MSDRELLELAAKAEGHDVAFDEVSGLTFLDANSGVLWNPLHNDGDALRLAVKLRMLVDGGYCCAISTETIHEEWWGGGDDLHAGVAHDECDPYAATRRAITRAAAEIGRSM
jgi:hypothetical protein